MMNVTSVDEHTDWCPPRLHTVSAQKEDNKKK